MRKKHLFTTAAIIISVISVSAFFYINADNLIKYEPVKAENQVTEALEKVNTIPEEIPYSPFYRMYLENMNISVTDIDGNSVYTSRIKDKSALTQTDIKQLETDGMYFTARSELVEILCYLVS